MTVLSGYLLRTLLVRLGVLLPGLSLVALSFDLADQGRRLAVNLGWGRVLSASVLHLPIYGVQLLPAAFILAMALSVAALRSRGELLAMAVAGAGPLRLGRAVVLCGLLCSLVAAALGELVVPVCEQRADALYGYRRVSPLTGLSAEPGWLRLGPWFLLARETSQGTELRGVVLDEAFLPSHRASGRLRLPSPDPLTPPSINRGPGPRSPDANALMNLGPLMNLEPLAPGANPPKARPRPALPLDQALDLWRLASHRPESLDFLALRRRVQQRRQAGQDAAVDALMLHTRLSYPLQNLLAALLCLGLLAPLPRTQTSSAGPGDWLRAVALILLLWFAVTLGWLLGRSGWLTPPMAVWFPPLAMALVQVLRLAIQAVRPRLHGPRPAARMG